MLDTINGLPVHALVVHAVVVLVPLAALGLVAIAVRPACRARYGELVVLCALAAVVLVPVATGSGNRLAARLGRPEPHAHLGGQLIYFAVPMLVVALALVVLDRRSRTAPRADGPGATIARSADRTASAPLIRAVAALAVLVAVANVVQVYRIGDSGARVVWEQRIKATQSRVG